MLDLSYKICRLTYSWTNCPFKKQIRGWYYSQQEAITPHLGHGKQPTQKWWHKRTYLLGMWLAHFNRSQRIGDRLVHLIPYNVRFKLG
jgi:hypothetical protein